MKGGRSIKFTILFLGILSSGTSPVCGQERLTEEERDQAIRKSWEFQLIRDRYNAFFADEIIRTIRSSFPHEVDTMSTIGLRFITHDDYQNAQPWFELCLRKEPDHILSNYGYAICRREAGKNLGLFGRGEEWRASERHFNKTIELDSTHSDVLYQYALLQVYKKNFPFAVQLVHRQLAANTGSRSGRTGIFRIYYTVLQEMKPEEFLSLLQTRNSFYDRYFMAEWYRLQDRHEEAETILQSLIANSRDFPLVPAFLSLVRIHVSDHRFERAEEMYWQAVFSVTNRAEQDLLLEDFLTIVDEKEYNLFTKDIPPSRLSEALHAFWLRRNPLPSLPYNARLIEHYRRINYAEREFTVSHFHHRGYKENESYEFHFPAWYSENYRYNDMGLIYIRYGAPDDRIFVQGRDPGDLAAQFAGSFAPNMSWLYQSREDHPQMVFHFTIPKTAPPGYWVLVPGFDVKEIWDALSTWSISRMGDYMMDRVADVDYALQTDRHTWPREIIPLEMDLLVDQYKKNDEQETIELSIGIPEGILLSGEKSDNAIELETACTIVNGEMIPAIEKRRFHTIRINDDSQFVKDLFLTQFTFDLHRTPVNITLHARIPEQNKLNGRRFLHDLNIPVRNRLSLSTLKPAFDISRTDRDGKTTRDIFKIIPNPTRTFPHNDPVYIYYEIYDLAFNTEGKTDYTVRFTLQKTGKRGLAKRIFGVFSSGKSYQVSVESNQTGDRRDVSDYIIFDMSNVKRGEYELSLYVTDHIMDETAVADRTIFLK